MAAQVDNNVLFKELQAIRGILENHGDRITEVERWRIMTESAEKAVAKYKFDNRSLISDRPSIFGEGTSREVVKLIAQALGIIGGLVAALTLALQYFLK